MAKKSIDLLFLEKGSSKRKWKGKVPVALVFPNTYHVGMSNLGFQLVFELINQNPDIVCERIFFPEHTGKVLSVESGRPLQSFPFIFCSISFEEDFPAMVKIFRLAGIEPLAEHRYGKPVLPGPTPLVIGGGVATFINPEPLAPFMDMLIAGEAEPVLPELLDFLLARYQKVDRKALLEDAAKRRSSCYVPSMYRVNYKGDGTLSSFSAPRGIPRRIKKSVLTVPEAIGHTRILTPKTEFADLFLVELGRGCSRGCRFCAAGFVYRPPRLWPADDIIKALSQRFHEAAGVGLLGMEMAGQKDLEKISRFLLSESCRLSFSSLRADSISPQLIALLEKSGLKSAAIAPDGGSERLRKVINKGITEDDVLHASEILVRAGIKNLKLYFMIGLPTETCDDLEELVRLTLKVKEKILAVGRPRGRLSSIILSVNCFVPKAWTPFQFHPFAPVKELKERLKFLRKQFGPHANIKMSSGSPDAAFFQAVLARGDRKVGHAILNKVDSGRNWRQVFREHGVDPEFYAMRKRGKDEIFPWEIIEHGIAKRYLWSEYQKALKGAMTAPCDTAKCKRCGICHGKNRQGTA